MTLRNPSTSSTFHRRFSSVPLRSFARHSLVINHSSSSSSCSSLRPSRRGLYFSGRQTEAVWPRVSPGQRYTKPTPSRVLSTRRAGSRGSTREDSSRFTTRDLPTTCRKTQPEVRNERARASDLARNIATKSHRDRSWSLFSGLHSDRSQGELLVYYY